MGEEIGSGSFGTVTVFTAVRLKGQDSSCREGVDARKKSGSGHPWSPHDSSEHDVRIATERSCHLVWGSNREGFTNHTHWSPAKVMNNNIISRALNFS